MSSRFSGKTKADLIAIARISGLLKTTVSQKMTKTELQEFLEAAEKKQELHASALSHREDTAPAVSAPAALPAEPVPSGLAEAGEPQQEKPAPTPLSVTKESENAAADDAAQPKKSSKEKRDRRTVKAEAEESPADETASSSRDDKAKHVAADRNSRSQRNKAKGSKSKGSGKGKSTDSPATETIRHEEGSAPAHAADSTESSEEKWEPRQDKERRLNRRQQKKAEDLSPDMAETSDEAEDPSREKTPHEPEMGGGILEIMPEGYGFLRTENYIQHPNDFYLPAQYIRRFNLRNGDYVVGPYRPQRDSDRYRALYYVKEVNGQAPDKMCRRPSFERLTPIYPNQRFILETSRTELSTRIIDLIAPIGKGQRGMIVSPPKAGKTILLQKIANAISQNNPTAKLIVLLIDERPEEVTDMQRSIQGEVVYSTFDKTPENHVKITELVLERAMRLVEMGEDVVILLDSITRMGRAYNLTINPTGRTLSGGLDPGALYGPKRFFGAARNIEKGGSLTIIATALVETGSRMDEVIFEEFKGTGNMEVVLDRKLSEKRIFPAIDINRSGTRREELLLGKHELDCVWGIRKAFSQLDTAAVTEAIISLLLKTRSNEQFIQSINVSFNDKSLYEAMRGSMSAGQKPANGNNGSQS